jgi:hypothetical protein
MEVVWSKDHHYRNHPTDIPPMAEAALQDLNQAEHIVIYLEM